MNAERKPPQIPTHHTQHYFAPGAVEHHKRHDSSHRHLCCLGRWVGRVLGLFLLAAAVAAVVNLTQRGGA